MGAMIVHAYSAPPSIAAPILTHTDRCFRSVSFDLSIRKKNDDSRTHGREMTNEHL